MIMLLNLLFVLSLGISSTISARILGIVPTPSYSHQVVFRPLWKELARRGHQVTVITTNPMNDAAFPNITEIDLSISYKKWAELDMNKMSQLNYLEAINKFAAFHWDFTNEQLLVPDVQDLLNNDDHHFDLVLSEMMMPAWSAFAVKFDCPLIRIISREGLGLDYRSIGNPSHPILYPDIMLGYQGKLSFIQRLMSVGMTLFFEYTTSLYYPIQSRLVKEHFGNHYPTIEKILEKTCLLFVNADPIFQPVRPLLPNVIPFGGGVHLTTTKPLSQKLQAHLDNATNGFIYFSLGSNIKSEKLGEETIKTFLETFAELPYTVLWKFEKGDIPGKPDNVITSKWFPQQDIFRHPNIKLFISQGGWQSLEEAIYNHVPVLGIPFIGDQKSNILKLKDRGMGLYVDLKTMDKSILNSSILELMHNPKYRNRVKKLADLALDQPMSGIERAVWWTEYAIRHKGASHLRSPSLDIPTYQYFLLDVIGFCLLLVGLVSYLFYKLIKIGVKVFKYFKNINKIKIA